MHDKHDIQMKKIYPTLKWLYKQFLIVQLMLNKQLLFQIHNRIDNKVMEQ